MKAKVYFTRELTPEKVVEAYHKPANKCQALIFCNAANFRFFLAFAQ
jgi:hypothetical protein